MTPEALNSQANFQFPQEIEMQLTIKIRVADQEERDYWISPDTGATAVGVIADVYDAFFFGEEDHVITINNLTRTQVQQILNSEAAL